MFSRRACWLGLFCALAPLAAEDYVWRLAFNGGGSNTSGIHLHPTEPTVRYLRLGDTGGYRSAAEGVAQVYTVGADNGGFRYENLAGRPDLRLTWSTTHGGSNRPGLADGTGIAYCETAPRFIAVVGGWDHGGRGGGGASVDGGRTWTPFTPAGLTYDSGKNDPKLGRIAVGATVQANGYPILVHVPRFREPRYSDDWGVTWRPSTGAPADISPSEWEQHQTLAADGVDGRTFYAYDDNTDKSSRGRVFRSTDGGATWTHVGSIPYSWNQRRMSSRHLKTRPGVRGEVWIALDEPYQRPDQEPASGLWRSVDGGESFHKIAGFERGYGVACGPTPGRPGAWTLYVSGQRGGQAGIYRSDDALDLTGDLAGATWTRLYDPAVHPPTVRRGWHLIEADRRTPGRVYAATLNRGLWVGQPAELPWPVPPAVTPWRQALRVNFQPFERPRPEGWRLDSGEAFAEREPGLWSGWNAPNARGPVARDLPGADGVRNTHVLMQPHAVYWWEVAVAAGSWRVTLLVGDASQGDLPVRLTLEGQPIVRQTTAAEPVVEITATITVTDGRLTIAGQPDTPGNRLCAVSLEPVP